MTSNHRSDLVLGLSLAEVILLLLFCFFLVVSIGSSGDGTGESPSVRIARLEEELLHVTEDFEAARAALKAAQAEIERQRAIMDQLAKLVTGGGKIDPQELVRIIVTKIKGFPPCAQENRLLEVSVIHGSIVARVAPLSGELDSALRSRGWEDLSGSVLRGKLEIQPFLDDVLRFEQAKGCRYSYRLEAHETGDDYRTARTYFERYLYPGGGQL
jgi:hypothetical protein